MTTKKKRTGIEWIGGLVSMPNYVTGEGEPYRPEALFWMGAEGAVLGSLVVKPGEALAGASKSLHATIARPIWGRPHTPERVRVASPELASALRHGHPGLDVVLAPTPEIDVFLAAMREKMGEEVDTGRSSNALPKVLSDKEPLLAAWDGGEPVVQTETVLTHAGAIEVTLRVPYETVVTDYHPPYDVLAALFELAQEEELDDEACAPLEKELVRRFVSSPEGKTLSDVQACRFVMEFAGSFFGATIATLEPEQLEEIIFEIIPRKVSIDASEASWIIEENRAFYAFLKREFGLEQADACLQVLAGDAVKELEAALSDSGSFDMAKSLLMGGREAGFDMDTQAGMEAWMRVVQSRPLGASDSLPSFVPRPVDKATLRKKKNQRKAARKARKKNR